MARYGRGQPHPPIFLRGAAAVVVAATIAPAIHVILARPAPRLNATKVWYVRPPRSSFVPDRLAPQIHVVGHVLRVRPAAHVVTLKAPLAPLPAKQSRVITQVRAATTARASHVIFVRTAAAPVVATTSAPQSHVVQAKRRTTLRAAIVFLRPSVTSLVPDRLAPQSHVVLVRKRPAPTHVAFVRNPQPTVVASPTLAPQVHVISPLARLAPAAFRRGAFLYVRPSRTSLVPDRLAPQSHVVLVRRITPPTHVIVERNPAVVAQRPAPQIHVVSLVTERLPVIRRAAVLYLRPSRTSLVPARLAPQIHVLLQRIKPRPTHVWSLRAVVINPVISLPLIVQDSSGARYIVLDASGVRYPVEDSSDVRYPVSDDSGPRYDGDDASGTRYEVT